MNLKPIIAFLNIVTYYNKQQACKPGSVSHQWCDFHHLSKQPTPRQRTGHPKAPVYLALQPARQAAPDVTTRPGGLLPRLLTLIPQAGRLFSSLLLYLHRYLPSGSAVPCVARTFLSGFYRNDGTACCSAKLI